MELQLSKHSVQKLKFVGESKSKQLKKIGIETIEDLLFHFPRRYEDRSNLKKISQLVPGEVETLRGKVTRVEIVKPRPRLNILKCYLSDGSDVIAAVWFNKIYLKKSLKRGTEIIVTGKVGGGIWGKEITVRDYEILSEQEELHSGRIVPVYPATEKVTQRFLRTLIWNALQKYCDNLVEVLPFSVRKKRKLASIGWAIKNMHFPDNFQVLEKARKTLAYEELFILQTALAKIKNNFQNAKGISHLTDNSTIIEFKRSLPFLLTGAQERVWKEIQEDMESASPMARLVQGDVGSGKTILAALALVKCCAGGFQGAMMAPTEILAEQHFLEFKKLLKPLGFSVELLVGSLTQGEKEKILEKIKTGTLDILIGTHTLIQEKVEFKNLGLVVIDEQHRFGVGQRSALKEKGYNPDMLVMTATPIPRTLALILYGDLDLSIVDELPPGRKEIITRYVAEKNRKKVYEFIKQQLKMGRQCYIVCPLIEESEKLDLEAAQTLAEKLQNQVFQEFKVALLHGKLKTAEKEKIMERFRDGEIDILVATTVVEVGVNVPNANIMVIEGAERFGLAQLHQLRGRIGRGKHQSYCILMGNPKSEESKKRLAIMTKTSDGFKIAEEDLKIRGPGEFFGTRQHGLPELKVANILKDQKILEYAKRDVSEFVAGRLQTTLEEKERIQNIILHNFNFKSL
ncbi:MAG: ATP-dependent helicase RecG [Clostridia bacterium]|jgi:ATP-dependent DNA helicase RecG|nr:ATP-dependent helicase RecG [Clostridiales bacterium]MDK2986633.1 ATP-dependent helicase RecG [Clostridia bacterium]